MADPITAGIIAGLAAQKFAEAAVPNSNGIRYDTKLWKTVVD